MFFTTTLMSSQYIVPDVSMKLDHTPTPMSPLRKVTTAKVDETGNRIGIVVKGLSGDAHDILSKEANFSALSTLLRTEEAVRNFRNISSYTTTIGLAEICPGLEDPNSVITAIETKIIITVITDWA